MILESSVPRPSSGLKSPNASSVDPIKTRRNNRQTCCGGTEPQERAPLPTGDRPKCKASFRAVSDQIVSEERLTSIETAPVAPLTSEQFLFRDAVAGIPVHIKEAVSNLVLGTLTANQKEIDNRLSPDLETLFIRTVHEVVNSLKFRSQFLDAFIDNSGFISPVAALVKSEKRKIVTEKAKIEERYRQFVEAVGKLNTSRVSVP